MLVYKLHKWLKCKNETASTLGWIYTSNAIDNNSKAVQTLKWLQLQAQLFFYGNYRIGENVWENVTFYAKF